MAVSIYNCWTCGTSLLGLDRPEKCFFWCTEEHQKEYEAKFQASLGATDEEPDEEPVQPAPPNLDAKKGKASAKKKSRQKRSQGLDKKKAARAVKRVRRLSDASKVSPLEKSGKRVYTCGVCGKKGHNARSCKKVD